MTLAPIHKALLLASAIRDGIRSVPDREQTDTEPRFIGLSQVGLLLQYNRSISEYNVGRFWAYIGSSRSQLILNSVSSIPIPQDSDADRSEEPKNRVTRDLYTS